jgi:alpha-galactosidase
LADQPAIEHDLPIICNEWCTSWGNPTHDNILALADKLQPTPVKFLVIDAGWYRMPGTQWHTAHGDWETSADFFSGGIVATARAVRERGLIPGLWFELETAGPESKAAVTMDDHFLKRDGVTIISGHRRFWNLRDPAARAYLIERVIDTLRRGEIGYLKIDYNETIGIGCEHPDSLGEGLRLHIEAVHDFLRCIREALPELVIENCSSGGHRLEPAFLALTAQSSFSDAHESVDIPVIAASLHRLLLPRQSQIWAVLRPGDAPARLCYSLAATFLGRMALSGNLIELDPEQWALCLAAQNLYRRAVPIIRDGTSILHGVDREDHRHPRGSQAVVRLATDGTEALVVIHAFPEDTPDFVDVPLPAGIWRLEAQFTDATSKISFPSAGCLRLMCHGQSTGAVVLLTRGGDSSL